MSNFLSKENFLLHLLYPKGDRELPKELIIELVNCIVNWNKLQILELNEPNFSGMIHLFVLCGWWYVLSVICLMMLCIYVGSALSLILFIYYFL